jgi:soluble lytic murein transglycosylase-like protein
MRKTIAAFIAAFFLLCGTAAQAAVRPAVASSAPTTIAAYAGVLHRINPQMPQWQSHLLASHLLSSAAHWKLDPNLLVALVTVESRWHTQAESRVGAIGLGQLMPGTAHSLHVNPHNATENLSGAARYLSGLLTRFRYHSNHVQLACAAYNAGPEAVSEYGGIPPYAETQNYVVRVMDTWHTIAKSIHVPSVAARSNEPDVAYWGG